MRKNVLKYLAPLLLLFITVQLQAQRDTAKERKDLEAYLKNYQVEMKDSVGHQYCVIQIPASFRNGIKGWTDYLSKNLNTEIANKYVKMKKTDSVVKQTIVVTFTVEANGMITNVKAEPAEKGVEQHPKIAAEAVRVVAEGPRWEPAEQESFDIIDGKVPVEAIMEKKRKGGFKKVIYRHKQSITFVVTKG